MGHHTSKPDTLSMKNLAQLLDPATYGLNRSAIVLGILAAVTAVLICSKLLAVLHSLQTS